MPKELIDKQFNDMIRRMNSIEPVDARLEVKLRIAFQEGLVKAQDYMIAQFTAALNQKPQ